LDISWYNNGKIKSIGNWATGATIDFVYDAMGNRINKIYDDGNDTITSTYYIRDAQGNVMAIYEWKNSDTLKLKELIMYGSDRLGTHNWQKLLYTNAGGVVPVSADWPMTPTLGRVGNRQFELKNHLGNVMATITDRKTFVAATNSYVPTIVTVQDYYPFGAPMPERSFNTQNYRYGWNTQERIDEIKGVGNHNTAKFWEYDTRLGRRWNLDPVIDPSESPYAANKNNPILYNDPAGDCPICPILFKGLAGLASASVEAGVQFSIAYSQPNATATSALKKLDAADITIAFVEGAATNGTNIPKILGRKAIAEGLKASIDRTEERGVEIVGGDKSIVDAGIDFGAGMTGNKASGAVMKSVEKEVAKDISSSTFKTLTKAEQQTLREVKNVVTGTTVRTGVEAVTGTATGIVGEKFTNKNIPTFTQPETSSTPSDATRVAPPFQR
jgi:hypothetical protein